MLVALLWILDATLVAWMAAEVVLQVRQYRQRGPTEVREWRSLGVIIGSVIVGNVLARVALAVAPGLNLPIPVLIRFAVALPVAWVGIAFRLWAIHSLGRYFRSVVHVQADHQVVQTGPYRWLRHPSYTGALLAVAGFSVLFANIASIILFTGAALAGIVYRIRIEERVLSEQLGSNYTDYADRIARLIPGVW